jgi:hypothetical protein
MDEGPAALQVPLCTIDIDGVHLTERAQPLFKLSALAVGPGFAATSSRSQGVQRCSVVTPDMIFEGTTRITRAHCEHSALLKDPAQCFEAGTRAWRAADRPSQLGRRKGLFLAST